MQESKKSEKPKAKRIKKRAEEAIESDPDEDLWLVTERRLDRKMIKLN